MKNETKHERFKRVVEQRMNSLILGFEKLGNCSTKVSYEYTDEEVELIFAELDNQMRQLRDRFSGKKYFTLSDQNKS